MKTKIDPAGRADARENRTRILAAAHDRFAAQGPSVGMDDIAQAAGVAVGTLYHHFGTKEALLEAVVLDGLEQVALYVKGLLVEPDAWAAVEKLLTYLAERQTQDRGFADWIRSRPALRSTTLGLKRNLGLPMTQILDRAKAAGVLRADLEITDLTALLAGCAEREGAQAQRRYLEIVLKGIRA